MDIKVELEGYNQYWEAGREIINVQVTLGQDEQSSSCTVVLADPTGKIASDLIKHTLTQGGIVALPKKSDGGSSSSSSSDSAATSPQAPSTSGDTSLAPFRKAFLDTIAYSEGTYNGADGGYKVLVGGGIFQSYADHPEIYVASANSTAAGRYQIINTTWRGKNGKPGVKQTLGLKDFSPASQDKAAISLIEGRKALGLVDSGSFEAAVHRCRQEWASFPGAGYKQHENTMAKLKSFYLARMKAHGVSTTTMAQKTEPKDIKATTKATTTATTATTTTTTTATTTTADTTTEVVKGHKLIVSIGSISFEFYHQGTETDQDGKTTLTGQGIRWALNRRKRNKTLQNLKLSDLAAKIAKAHGVKLDYQAKTDITYDHIDQSGISDYQLLLRECQYAGLFVSESKGVLTVKALTNIQDSLLVLAPGNNLIAWKVKDEAVDDKKDDKSSLLQDESKVRLNPITGQFEQTKPDIDKVKDRSVTGKASDKPRGKVQPGQEAVADQARSRKKRVRGLPSTFVIPLSPESLVLEPLQAVRTTGLTGVLSRIWLIDSVSHDVAEGKTTLSCYSPIEVLDTSSPEAPTQAATNTDPGKFIFPCHGFPVTDTRRQRTPTRFHHGTDIGCPIGTKLVAAMDGVVTVSGNQQGYGLVIYLKHPNGWETRYAHCSELKVRVGQQVKQGQEIALSGNTGIGTGAHVHFEIRKPPGADGKSHSADPAETNLGAVKKGQVI